MRRWVREPLLHFILAGVLIYLVAWLWPARGDEHTIRIGRQQLASYLQDHAGILDGKEFDAYYRALSEDARAALIHRVAVDEALYRQGLALGLDRADPLIRLRIIQQMRDFLGDADDSARQLTEAELTAYYNSHRDAYRQDESISFAHVFFSAGGDAQQRARAELARLRAAKTPPADAAAHGERFLYETVLDDASRDDVQAKFGAEFTAAVFAQSPGQWQGPLRSEHGWHLVLVTAHAPARDSTREELGLRLKEDAQAARRQSIEAAQLTKLLGDYRIVTARDLPQ